MVGVLACLGAPQQGSEQSLRGVCVQPSIHHRETWRLFRQLASLLLLWLCFSLLCVSSALALHPLLQTGVVRAPPPVSSPGNRGLGPRDGDG